jgi:hypothetical protein
VKGYNENAEGDEIGSRLLNRPPLLDIKYVK